MTAYLKPGDKIHIAIGIANPAEMAVKYDEVCRMYELMGVEVLGGTGSTLLSHPVVVAVVRNPEAMERFPEPGKVKPVDLDPH